MDWLTPNARGALYMALGSLAYVLNDVAVRLAADEQISIYQVLCVRGAIMAILFASVARVRHQTIRISHVQRPVLLRVLAEMVSTGLFFAALVRMEFANAQAILQIVPLAVTLAAAIILRERVSKRRWATILIGFLGVLIIIRPATEGFTVWSLVVLASVFAMVSREFATRRVGGEVPGLSIALLTALGNTGLFALIALAGGWGRMTSTAVYLILIASGLLFFGYLLTIETIRIGDLSVSAPFRYTILLGAVAAGYLVFDEAPDNFTLAGSALILLTGLYSVRLDRRRSRPAGSIVRLRARTT